MEWHPNIQCHTGVSFNTHTHTHTHAHTHAHTHIYIHIYIYHHYSQGELIARILVTVSHYPSPSAIVLDESSWRHSESAQTWWKKIFANYSTLVYPCIGVHRRTSLMSWPVLLQQYSVYFARLTWMVCEIRNKWPYSYCFVECCFQDLFKTASSILL